MVDYIKSQTYHVQFDCLDSYSVNQRVEEWVKENPDAIVQNFTVIPIHARVLVTIFFSYYPLNCPWHKDYNGSK